MIKRGRTDECAPRHEGQRWLMTCGPGLGWLALLFFIPLALMLCISFIGRGPYGELRWELTLSNYARILGLGPEGVDLTYPRVVLRSLLMSVATTFLCATAALPLCFFIARLPQKWRHTALLLVVIPFWTNLLIRTYAWQILFSGSGWLARMAASVGWVSTGEALYPSVFAVFVVLTCDYLPFLALPLYASVEKIDWAVAEAAGDLGANRWNVFRHALLPQIQPGLLAGAVLVFAAATGQFVIPDLLGGAKTVLLGNAIQQQFGFSRNWPFGAALGWTTMALVSVALWWFLRRTRAEERERVL